MGTVVSLPELSHSFIVETGAIRVSFAAVLIQEDNGDLCAVSFMSQMLSVAEKNCNAQEWKYLAVAQALDKFQS